MGDEAAKAVALVLALCLVLAVVLALAPQITPENMLLGHTGICWVH